MKEKQLGLFDRSSPKQLWLIHFNNPLIPRFGREFFRGIPKEPGVYFMKNERGDILYIGKAKSLRARLMSYTRANPDNVSRKVLRLLQVVRVIEWKILPDETSALLEENSLLRRHNPYFNVVNTAPHTYLYFHLRLEENGFRIHLDMNCNKDYKDVFGAFKALGLCYRAHKAMLRLLWLSFNECKHGFELPARLTNRRKLSHALFERSETIYPMDIEDLYRKLVRFFKGTSHQLLVFIVEKLLTQTSTSGFISKLIQDDIDTLTHFYKHCARRSRRIKQALNIKEHVFPQDKIDDYLVLTNAIE